MAARTADAGGRYIPPDEFRERLRELRGHDLTRQRREKVVDRLADSARRPLLVIFCVALVAEWSLRRRSGLV